jgi:inositol-phosphate phosphatase / L-galactose 1-phosphate phosphatase / histidinol-phosphatase
MEPSQDLMARAALALRLADASGAVIRPLFRTNVPVDIKPDASPVTLADHTAEQAIRDILAQDRPTDGIIGEEYGAERADAEWVWVIDPIDGTRSFMAGRPIFGTLIAALCRGKPVIGVIDQPITGDRWLGVAGQPTRFRDGLATTRPCAGLEQATIATTGPQYLQTPELAAYERLSAKVRTSIWGGDCYNYGLVAAGFIDIVVEAGLKLHDFAALAPVVEGAGGRMTDWAGKPLDASSAGQVVAVGDPGLLPSLLGTLSGSE